MINNGTQFNNSGNRNPKKPLLIAVGVLVALLAVALILLFNVNGIYYFLAERQIKNNDFVSAQTYSDKVTSEKGELLDKYVNVRLEINEKYPTLLTNYDGETINSWLLTLEELVNNNENLPESIKADVISLYSSVKRISDNSDGYYALKQDILDMMDVFNELNRLYTKDSEGKNTVFTLAQETEKIERWEGINERLESYQNKLSGESVYLLNYLIKESKGECEDLRKAMQVVTDAGFGENDTVRLSGDGHKTFPGITNSTGNTVSVSGKEDYENYLCVNVHRNLIESELGQYYY